MSLAGIILASALACQPAATQAQIGLWESDETSVGGIGSNIEFRADGSFVAAIVVLVDLKYDIKNDILYTAKNKGEPVSYEAGAKIIINDDSYSVVGTDSKPHIRKRIDNFGSKSLHGKYKYRHYSGGIAWEHFTSKGMLHLRIPMSSNRGCYSVNGNVFNIIAENKEPQSILYELNSGKLVLIRDNKRSGFSLVKEGVWYESHPIDYARPVEPSDK